MTAAIAFQAFALIAPFGIAAGEFAIGHKATGTLAIIGGVLFCGAVALGL